MRGDAGERPRTSAVPPALPVTGSNNTSDTVAFTTWAQEAGVDACLLVSPYYNKPNAAGLKAHALAVAAVGLPILLYNIPGRTGVKMAPECVLQRQIGSLRHTPCVAVCAGRLQSSLPLRP